MRGFKVAKVGEDQFANMAILTITESGVNTLTFKKIETGISLYEKVAWVVNRIEYLLTIGVNDATFNTDGDAVLYGLSGANNWSAPAFDEATVYDYNSLSCALTGAVVSKEWIAMPFIKDLSTMPGGGLLIPPTPFYGFLKGVGLTGATAMVARIMYTMLKMSVDQYWELVEARRPIQS
jgi:hypothetical protein